MTFRQLIPPLSFAGWWTVHGLYTKMGERQNPWDWHTYFHCAFLPHRKCFPQTERKNHYDYYYYFIRYYNLTLKLLTYFIRQIVFFSVFYDNRFYFFANAISDDHECDCGVESSAFATGHTFIRLWIRSKNEKHYIFVRKNSLEFRASFVCGKFN